MASPILNVNFTFTIKQGKTPLKYHRMGRVDHFPSELTELPDKWGGQKPQVKHVEEVSV